MTCRRSNGSYRKCFTSKEIAEKFAADINNGDYNGDIAHLCHKCGQWHLSKPEWLVMGNGENPTS